MIPEPLYLENHQALSDAFGYWPGFHDSPVISMSKTGDQIDLRLVVWEMTSRTDARGYYVLEKRHAVHFRFTGLAEISLPEPDDSGDILFALLFSHPDEFSQRGCFEVTMDSVMDKSGSFKARHGAIVEIFACDQRGNRIEPNATIDGT